MFIVVVVVFAIFMFPNQVVWLWADFGGGINSPDFTKLSIICWLFTYTNCVVNPVIFGVFSKDFRKGFKRIFKSIIGCCETSALKDRTERLQFQSITKTGSDSTESNTVDCELYRKDSNFTFLSIQAGEQTTGLQDKPDKQFQEKTTTLNGLPLQKTESFSNGHEKPHQPITIVFSFKPEGESRHLNNGHLGVNSIRQWNALPHSISCSETLKNALNSSRETYC